MNLTYEEGTLADQRLELIERWARELGSHPKLGLCTTHKQRRVIASLFWKREVAKSNAHMPGTVQQPPPVAGLDAKDRVVVQCLEYGQLRMWSLYKSGDPADITEPVVSLADGRRVIPPNYARSA